MTSTATGRPILKNIDLAKGGHNDRADGVCVMELAAWIADRPHTDRPPCVSLAIGAFLRSWNDGLDDKARQKLKPYARKVLNTATTAQDEQTRGWMATDWLVRECAPAFLRTAGLTAQAELLEALAPVTSTEAARNAQPTLNAARKDAAAAGAAAGVAAEAAAEVAAGAAARAAARDAAWDAAGAAAGAAAGVAAWAAAEAAAEVAAGAAARDAARAAAWDAARAAARAAAWDAARAAARDAARAAARDAARAAARAALEPTTKMLQKSAFGLLDRMIEVGKAP